MKSIFESAKQLKPELISIRRTLHQYPEIGCILPRTQSFVFSKLEEYGYCPQKICESAVIATISGKQPGKTILLRADMDALPIKEAAPVPFASENGYMHACGHDMHTTMLLGAAKLLKHYQQDLVGTVKLVFQPDEEGFTGAKALLKAGVLENPHVDAGIAFHVVSGIPSGTIMCGSGTCMAGCILFQIHIKGTGCHGAMPEAGVDPINIAAHVYLSLQEIIAREIAPTQPAALTIGRFTAGEAPNIIPEDVILEGSIRTMDYKISKYIFDRIEEISIQTASLFRGQACVKEIASAPPLQNDSDMVKELTSYMKECYEPHKIVLFEQGGMGSEDFASYTYERPCCYMLIGAGTPDENPLFGKPMHNDHVVFNEEILSLGSALYASNAINWLRNHSQ